jgi:hypothetical protein
MDQAALIALIIAVCGVIYNAGKQAQRVESMEKGMESIPAALRDGFDKLASLIREGRG